MNTKLKDFQGNDLRDGEYYRIYPVVAFDQAPGAELKTRDSIPREELDDKNNWFGAFYKDGKLMAMSDVPPYKPIANISGSYINYPECVYPFDYFNDEGDNLSKLDPADPIMPDGGYAQELKHAYSESLTESCCELLAAH